MEKALEKKSDHLQAVAAEGVADELIVNEILEENAPAETAEETTETVESAAADAGDAADVQDPWAGIDAEVEAINAETEDKDKE